VNGRNLRETARGMLCLSLLLVGGVPLLGYATAADDVASAFGARPDVTSLRLSPDGQTVVFLAPAKGQGNAVYTIGLTPDAKPRLAATLDGKPFRFTGCNWVANDRLVCEAFGLVRDPEATHGPLPVSRILALNADGSNVKLVSTTTNLHSRGYLLSGGRIIDWLPDQDGSILMARPYVPDTHLGSHMGSEAEGLGVDLIDTRTLAVKHVVTPHKDNFEYLSDGRGNVRIIGVVDRDAKGDNTGEFRFLYCLQGASDWHPLATYNQSNKTGFLPVAVDHDLNVAYGWKQLNGRTALYSMSLDATPHETLIYSRPDVDLDGLVRVGRRNRVIGVAFSTDLPRREFFQDEYKQMMTVLHRALPQQPLLSILDSSVDESKMLLFAGSDADPGVYYIFDRKAHQLQTFLEVRPQLDHIKLANVKPISYPAADGVMIPAYLTLPAGTTDAHGLPAIVMPHGGPSARDDWGFDWLAQFYAARGYAVLQPNYRGSSGYGDEWFEHNGFRSWNVAVGDVVAAGHWLVSSGLADPARLGIVGWSYGGYAALQSADLDPGIFKAIVAVAPVTDLAALKEERRGWTDFEVVSNFIGDGPNMRDGSPINHVDKFKQPVLLFHGTQDRNVGYEESRRMVQALKGAGVSAELVTFEDRDHQLEDSEARTDMLRQSDAFLRKAFGMSP
jgi:acetyl esterase/lipase